MGYSAGGNPSYGLYQQRQPALLLLYLRKRRQTRCESMPLEADSCWRYREGRTRTTRRGIQNADTCREDILHVKGSGKIRTQTYNETERGARSRSTKGSGTELVSPDCTDADRESKLHEANRQALELAPQVANVSAQLKALKAKRLTEGNVSKAFQSIEMFWEDLFPLERHRLIQLLVERITIKEDGLDIELKTNGLTALVSELASVSLDPISSASSNKAIGKIALGGSPIMYEPQISITESGNLLIHVPILIRRQRGRKIIIADLSHFFWTLS